MADIGVKPEQGKRAPVRVEDIQKQLDERLRDVSPKEKNPWPPLFSQQVDDAKKQIEEGDPYGYRMLAGVVNQTARQKKNTEQHNRAFRGLLAGVDNEVPSMRQTAISMLGQIQLTGEEADETVTAIIPNTVKGIWKNEEPDTSVVVESMQALERLYPNHEGACGHKISKAIEANLECDDPLVRAQAISSYTHVKPKSDIYWLMRKSTDAVFTRELVDRLLHDGRHDVIEHILNETKMWVGDPDVKITYEALDALVEGVERHNDKGNIDRVHDLMAVALKKDYVPEPYFSVILARYSSEYKGHLLELAGSQRHISDDQKEKLLEAYGPDYVNARVEGGHIDEDPGILHESSDKVEAHETRDLNELDVPEVVEPLEEPKTGDLSKSEQPAVVDLSPEKEWEGFISEHHHLTRILQDVPRFDRDDGHDLTIEEQLELIQEELPSHGRVDPDELREGLEILRKVMESSEAMNSTEPVIMIGSEETPEGMKLNEILDRHPGLETAVQKFDDEDGHRLEPREQLERLRGLVPDEELV